MKCIYCKLNTRVTDKRESPNGTRRRRECLKCKKRFTTYEKADKKSIIVVKNDNRREPFSMDKLKNGLMRACMKRPISVEKIEKIIELFCNFDKNIDIICNKIVFNTKILNNDFVQVKLPEPQYKSNNIKVVNLIGDFSFHIIDLSAGILGSLIFPAIVSGIIYGFRKKDFELIFAIITPTIQTLAYIGILMQNGLI